MVCRGRLVLILGYVYSSGEGFSNVGVGTSRGCYCGAYELEVVCKSFGVAVGGVIFQNQWEVEVAKRIADGTIPAGYRVGSGEAEVAYGVIKTFPDAVQESYGWVYSDSLRMVWVVMTVISAVGLLASLMSRDESLDKGGSSRQGFRDGNEGEGLGEEGVKV